MKEKICSKCKPYFEELAIRVVGLEKKNEELEKRLLAYENAHTPPSKQRNYPKREKGVSKVGAPKGHKGITRKTPTPTESKILSIDTCPKCKHDLGKPIKFVRRVIEELPDPQPLRVIEFFVSHYDCPHCNQKIIATDLELPQEGKLGNNLQVEIAHLRYEDRLPLRMIVQTLNRKYPNLNLSAATVLDVLRRVKNKLKPVYQIIKQNVKKSANCNADETGAKLNGKKHWLWVFMSLNHVLFCFSKKRKAKVIEKVLGKDYLGIVTCDGFKGYPNIVKNIQRCWAHLLREAKFLAQKYGGQAKLLYGALCIIFNKIKIVTTETSKKMREKIYYLCIGELESWIKTCKAYTELQALVTTIKNGLKQWFTCILHPEIEPTNNRAERELRKYVIQRKISGSFRSTKGLEIAEVIMSVLATWKLQGLNTVTLLKQTLSS